MPEFDSVRQSNSQTASLQILTNTTLRAPQSKHCAQTWELCPGWTQEMLAAPLALRSNHLHLLQNQSGNIHELSIMRRGPNSQHHVYPSKARRASEGR